MKSRALESGVDVTALIVVGNVIWISGRDGSLQIRHLGGEIIRTVLFPSSVGGFYITKMVMEARKVWLGCSDGKLRVYNVSGSSELHVSSEHEYTDWGIVQRSVKDGSIIRRLSGHEGSVRCMTVASAPSRVSRYDTPSAEPALDASVGLNQTGPVRVDSHHSDRQSHGQKVQLWSAADDGIRVWNMEGQCIASLKNESAAAVVSTLLCVTFWDEVRRCAVDRVWSGGEDKKYIIWSTSTRRPISISNCPQQQASIDLCAVENSVWSLERGNHFTVWDSRTGELLDSFFMDGGSRGDTGSNSGDTSPNHNIANITGGAIDSHHNNDNKNSTANGMAKNHTLGRLKCLAYQANSLWIGGNSSFSLSIFDVSPTSSSSSSPIPSSPSASSSATSAMSMPMSNSLSIPVSTPMSTSFAPHFSTTPGTSLTNSRSKHLPRQPGLRRQQQQVQRHGTPVQPSLSSLALPVSPLPFVDASFSSSYIATPLPKSHATAHTRSHSPPAHMLIRPSSKTAAPVAASSPSGLMPASAAAAVAEGPVRDAGMNANAGERKAVSPLELRRSVSFSEATPLSPTSPGSPSIDLPLPLPSPAFASLEALPVPSDVSTALSTWGLLHGLERDIRRNTSLKAGVIDAAMQQKKKALLKGLDEDQRHRLLLYLLHNEAKGEAVDEDLKENIVRVLAYPHTPAPATTPQRRGKRGGPGGEDGETGKGQTTNMHKKTTSKSGHSNSSYKHGSGDSGDAGGRVSSPLRQPFASSSSPSFLSQTLASAQTPLNRRSRHRHQHHSQHTWQRSSSASTSSPPAPRSAMKGKRGETHTHTRHVSATQHASAHTRTNTTGAIDANTDLDLLEIDKVNVNLMREVRVMRETVGQLTSKNAHLSSEKKRLASSLGELRGKYKSQRKLLQSMQSNVQTKDIIRQLEHEKHVLHTRVQSLQGELDTRSNAYTQREMHTNTRITDLETEREQARGEVADAKLRVTMLQEEQSKIRTAMVDVGKECLQVKWAHLLSNGIHDLPSVVPANGSISKDVSFAAHSTIPSSPSPAGASSVSFSFGAVSGDNNIDNFTPLDKQPLLTALHALKRGFTEAVSQLERSKYDMELELSAASKDRVKFSEQVTELTQQLEDTQSRFLKALADTENARGLLMETQRKLESTTYRKDHLEAELEEVVGVKSELEDTHGLVLGEMQVMKTASEHKDVSIKQLESELAEGLAEKTQALERLESEEKAHRATQTSLNTVIDDMRVQIEGLGEEIEQKRSELAEAMQKTHLLDTRMQQNEVDLATLRAVEKEKMKLDQSYLALEIRLKESEEKLLEEREEREADAKTHAASKDSFVKLVNDQTTTIDELTTQHNALTLQVRESEESVAELRQHRSTLERTVGSQMQRISGLEAEVAALEALGQQKEQQSEEEQASLTEKLRRSQHTVKELSISVNDAQSQVQAAQSAKEETQGKLRAVQGSYDALQQEKAELESSKKRVEEVVAVLSHDKDEQTRELARAEDSLAALSRQLSGLQDKHATLVSQHQQAADENQTLKQESAAQKSSLQVMESEKRAAEASIHGLKEEISRQTSNFESLKAFVDARIAELTSDKQRLAEERDAKAAALSASDSTREELKARLQDAQGRVTEQSQRLQLYREEVGELSTKHSELEASSKELAAVYEGLTEANALTEEQLSITMSNLEATHAGLQESEQKRVASEALAAELQAVNATQKGRIETLEEEKAEADAAFAGASQKLALAHSENTAVAEELASTQETLQRTTGELEAVKVSTSETDRQHDEQVATLQESILSLSGQLREARTAFADEESVLHARSQDAQARCDHLQGTLESRDSAIASLQKELQECSLNKASIHAQYTEVKHELQALTAQLQSKDSEMQVMGRLKESLQTSCEELTALKTQQEGELSAERQQHQEVVSQLAEQTLAVQQYDKTERALVTSLRETEGRVEGLRRERANLEQKIEAMKTTFAAHRREKDDLIDALKRAEGERRLLETSIRDLKAVNSQITIEKSVIADSFSKAKLASSRRELDKEEQAKRVEELNKRFNQQQKLLTMLRQEKLALELTKEKMLSDTLALRTGLQDMEMDGRRQREALRGSHEHTARLIKDNSSLSQTVDSLRRELHSRVAAYDELKTLSSRKLEYVREEKAYAYRQALDGLTGSEASPSVRLRAQRPYAHASANTPVPAHSHLRTPRAFTHTTPASRSVSGLHSHSPVVPQPRPQSQLQLKDYSLPQSQLHAQSQSQSQSQSLSQSQSQSYSLGGSHAQPLSRSYIHEGYVSDLNASVNSNAHSHTHAHAHARQKQNLTSASPHHHQQRNLHLPPHHHYHSHGQYLPRHNLSHHQQQYQQQHQSYRHQDQHLSQHQQHQHVSFSLEESDKKAFPQHHHHHHQQQQQHRDASLGGPSFMKTPLSVHSGQRLFHDHNNHTSSSLALGGDGDIHLHAEELERALHASVVSPVPTPTPATAAAAASFPLTQVNVLPSPTPTPQHNAHRSAPLNAKASVTSSASFPSVSAASSAGSVPISSGETTGSGGTDGSGKISTSVSSAVMIPDTDSDQHRMNSLELERRQNISVAKACESAQESANDVSSVQVTGGIAVAGAGARDEDG